MSIWKSSSSCDEKPWGSESAFSSPFGMGGKIIDIKSGKRTSLKYYLKKNQVMYVLSGRISVFAPNEKEFGDMHSPEGNYFDLKKGDIILIQSENPYRIKAIEDSKIVEVCVGAASYHNEFVMLEDDFGRKNENVCFDQKDN